MRKHTLLSVILMPVLTFSVSSMTVSHAAEQRHDKSSQQPRLQVHKKDKGAGQSGRAHKHADRHYRTIERPERRSRPHRRARPDYRDHGLYIVPHRDRERHYDRTRPDYRHDHRRPHHRDYKHRRDYKYRRPHTVVVIPSRRHHRHYIQVRPFHYGYPRYKRLYHDDDFWGWLAFTAITLEIIDYLNDEQQRAHERALYQATTAPLGQAQSWSQGDVSGSVTPVWEGPSDRGQYCREYRHDIKVGGRTEIAYGTACRRADGSWEIVQ